MALLTFANAGSAFGQPGSGGVVVIDGPSAEQGRALGSVAAAGVLFTPGQADLVLGVPDQDHATFGENSGGWLRYAFMGRTPLAPQFESGQWSHGQHSVALAVIHSSDTPRLVSGDARMPADGATGSGRVSVWRGPTMPGPDLDQNTPVLLGQPELEDHFGQVLAVGNFNGDAYQDLAVAAPGEGIASPVRGEGQETEERGAVFVYYGAGADADFQTGDVLTSDLGGAASTFFGSALATGDFDGDGFGDLAIGEPGAVDGEERDVGAVHLYFGSASGLQTASPKFLLPSDFAIPSFEGLQFGASLASADFDPALLRITAVLEDDLAIGVPGYVTQDRGLGLSGDEGAVVIAFGADNTGSLLLRQHDFAGGSSVEPNERFGEALWAGEFDGRPGGDLAVGVPRNHDGGPESGVLHLAYGGPLGLATHPGHMLTWAHAARTAAQSGDGFGSSFASGDFDGDGSPDVAIGAPGREVGGHSRAGQVVVLFGGCLFCDGFEGGDTNAW